MVQLFERNRLRMKKELILRWSNQNLPQQVFWVVKEKQSQQLIRLHQLQVRLIAVAKPRPIDRPITPSPVVIEEVGEYRRSRRSGGNIGEIFPEA